MNLKVFIGYDSREPEAYHVAEHSLQTRASRPVSVTRLALPQLKSIYKRERKPNEATEFSLTRFLVPYLSGYEGHSVFMDCDMLVQADIYDLLLYPLTNPKAGVHVCPHDYTPKFLTKMDGKEQTNYPCKNWSSFMLFDNSKCKALTPDYVNTAPPADLHRLKWTDKIGFLPLDWNWLVDEYEPNPKARILHYTNGGPWFEGHKDCDHADLWLDEYSKF